MAHNFESDDEQDENDILSGADEPGIGDNDDTQDFERYLREKDKQWTKPVSEMTVKTTPRETSFGPASDVEAESSNEPDSEDESGVSSNSIGAVVVGEKVKHLELHKHPVIGSYVVESVSDGRVDAEFIDLQKEILKNPDRWKEITIERVIKPLFSSTDESGEVKNVLKLDGKGVITAAHRIEQAIFYLRAVQGTLRGPILEEFLKAETAEHRLQILELDRKYRAKHIAKAKGEAKPKVKATTAVKSKGKTVGQKRADALKGMDFDKAAAEKHLRTQNVLDAATQAYVDKIYSK